MMNDDVYINQAIKVLEESYKIRDSKGSIHGDVTIWGGEGDGYKHIHIFKFKGKKVNIAVHLNVPAYFIHKDHRGTFKNNKDLHDFTEWMDSPCDSDPSLSWWQFFVNTWNSMAENRASLKLQVLTKKRPPYESGMYRSYNDCIKHEPFYKKW